MYALSTRYTPDMPRQKVIEHPDEDDTGLQDPDEFLDRAHPENDQYMQGVEHIQRQIMHQTTLLRSKQVQILKSVFAGNNFIETGRLHGTAATTVSRLVKSENGQRLLNLLQYHLKLIEGPNEAQRRNMLWRMAQADEKLDPKTAIKALAELNKMHYQTKQLDQALTTPNAPAAQVHIHIDQNLMPRGNLD